MQNNIVAHTKQEYEAAANLFKEYAAGLGIDLCFQHFDEELSKLEEMYGPHHGGIILYQKENEFAGCVGIRRFENDIAELKRMYVKPAYRKQGIGNILLNEAIALARKCNYRKIRLDTLDIMNTAIKLYKEAGFYEIGPYYFNPEPNVLYFEKNLQK